MRAKLGILFGLMVLMLSMSAAAQVVPAFVAEVRVDDTELLPFGSLQLDLERDNTIEIDVELMAFADADDVVLTAEIDGYEHGDIRDRKGPFDVRANVTYKRTLLLTLPDDIETGDYKLRVTVRDRDSQGLTYTYDLHINTARHSMKIVDVVVPSGVQAGRALVGFVRVENLGQLDENDVRVEMKFAGQSDVKYIEEVDADDEERTEEFFLRLPTCLEPGTYELMAEVLYNDRHDRVVEQKTVTVLENPACAASEPEPVVIVEEPENAPVVTQATPEVTETKKSSSLRTALEVILVVLVALLVIVGLIIGFSRLNQEE